MDKSLNIWNNMVIMRLDEFKAATLEQKKAILDQRLADGNLTQEQADAIYNRLVTNQATCDKMTL